MAVKFLFAEKQWQCHCFDKTIITMNLVFTIFMTGCIFVVSSTSSSINVDEYFPDERDALIQLRDSMNSTSDLHSLWTGPPCINNRSRWPGIACSNWHVIHIVLDGIRLTGSLPPTFLHNITFLAKLSMRNNSISGPLPLLSNLEYLETVFLSKNQFSGSIPVEYTRLQKLAELELQENDLVGQLPPFDQPTIKVFNVSHNKLGGPIPETGVLQRFPKSSFDYNAKLCGGPSGKPCPVPPPPDISAPHPDTNTNSSYSKTGNLHVWRVGLVVAAAAGVPFLAMTVVFWCNYRRIYGKEGGDWEQKVESSGEELEKNLTGNRVASEIPMELEFLDNSRHAIHLEDLLSASAEFLGKGKLGSTYKAALHSGPVVAVKRLEGMHGLSKHKFAQQMQLLGQIRHQNLVEIISFYNSDDEKLVIYEYAPNGNLIQLLHENRGEGRVPLNWETRLSIIRDIAKGLSFLHKSLPSHKVPHANLKSSNVLIFHNGQHYKSKLTDFGFLTLLPTEDSSAILAVGKSPEYSQGKKLTYKADVYCFGIIILEVITGRIAGESSIENNEATKNLHDWVRTAVNNDWYTDIFDAEMLVAEDGEDEMLKLIKIALQCTDVVPEKRPEMTEVLMRIEEIKRIIEQNKSQKRQVNHG